MIFQSAGDRPTTVCACTTLNLFLLQEVKSDTCTWLHWHTRNTPLNTPFSQCSHNIMEPQPSLHDLLRSVPASKLGEPCTDIHFADIANGMVTWELFAPYMSLSEAEEEEIKCNHRTYFQQKLASLRRWKTKYANKATYQHLIHIFWKAGSADLGFKVASMLKHIAPLSIQAKDDLDAFHQYLVELYRQEPPPGTAEFPFTPAQEFQYIELSLNAKTRSGLLSIKMGDILAYGEDERKVTLLEGAAGSGKSTLMWQLKQKWAMGELYPEIQLLICINLRHPQYHTAKELFDLIPCPDEELKPAVVKYIKKQFGAGLCFLWDGWDEVPYRFQRRSYIYNLLAGRIGDSLPRARFLITSRSIGTTIVRGIAPKRIEIAPFSRQQTMEYFTVYTHLSHADLEVYLKENEYVFSLCDLPVNASLVSYTLRDPKRSPNSPLPKTQTELFKSLTTNLLFSEAERRSEMDDLEVLPDTSELVFRRFCCLSYDGLFEGKSVFFRDDLISHDIDVTGLDDTQGLMIADPVLTSLGLDKSYTFRHLTFQEYMAAYHLKDQPAEKQCEAITKVIQEQPDRKDMVPFLAGITGLKDESCLEIFKTLWLDLLTGLAQKCTLEDSQPMFHLLIKCAFEAQSEALFLKFHSTISSLPSGLLALQSFQLRYQDIITLTHILTRDHLDVSLTLDVTSCTLDSGVLEIFARKLQSSQHCPTGVRLILDNTKLCREDINALAILLSETTALTHLSLNECTLTHDSLQLIGKALTKNTTLQALAISNNAVSSTEISLFLDLLQSNQTLQELKFDCKFIQAQEDTLKQINEQRRKTGRPILTIVA